MCWCRSRSTTPIPTACPTGLRSPGDIVNVPLGAREATGRGVGRRRHAQSAARQPPQGCRRTSSTTRRSSPSCADSSTGSRTTRSSPRGMVLRMCLRMGEHLGRRARAHRRAARRPAAEAHDAGAPSACWRCSPTAWLRSKGEAAEEAGVQSRRDRRRWSTKARLKRCRCRPEPVARAPDPAFCTARFD